MLICEIYHYKAVKAKVERNGDYDKYKHCSVSCLLTLRCPAITVQNLGIIKELLDVIGPGNAELNDLVADFVGVEFADSGKAKTDAQCMNKCHETFPKPIKCK